MEKELELIRKSKYFDADYYYAARPDVLAAKVDAAVHYLSTGWKEGANPGPDFNTAMYLALNKNTGRCPLVDYIRAGCNGDYSGNGASAAEIAKYRQHLRTGRATTVCYTYVSSGYDKLISHNHIVFSWDYVCFTDDEELLKKKYVGIWCIKRAKCSSFDAKRNSGWHKTHPEICCRRYENSVWVDANVNILSDYLAREIKARKSDILVPIHYARDCIFDEVTAVIDAGRDTPSACAATRDFLAAQHMPRHYGLNETNIVFRRHGSDVVRRVDKLWWECIQQYSKRDQLSFSYALWKNGIKPSDIAINNTRTDAVNFCVKQHFAGSHKKHYDIVYSIGRDCACSFYLTKNNLRTCSGPLDWITTADFKQRFDMLLNNFADFMNPKYFEFLPKNPNIFNDDKCDYYRNVKTGFDFYHDFPAGVPLSESFPAVAEKYNRRINRFYQNIKDKKKVLLVYFSHYTSTPDSDVIRLCDMFCKKMHKDIDFLVIEHKEGQMNPVVTNLRPNITRWHLHTWARDDNGTIMVNGNEALVNPIFAEYCVDDNIIPKSFCWKLSAWVRLHLLCSLIPVPKWRHSARHHIRRELGLKQEKTKISSTKPATTAPEPTALAAAPNAAAENMLLRYCGAERLPLLLRDRFFAYTGKLPTQHLETFREKVIWSFMFDVTPLKVKCADKLAVRDYVRDTIGERYLPKLYAVYKNPDEFDIGALPRSFMLTYNAGSGQNLIVSDKSELNIDTVRKTIAEWLRYNHSEIACEMQYRDIPPRVIARELVDIRTDCEYKLWCFGGRVEFIVLNSYRDGHDNIRVKTKDRDWNNLGFYQYGSGFVGEIAEDVPAPSYLSELIEIAEKLAAPFDFVRVDFYETPDGRPVFGELTFSPTAGGLHYMPDDNAVQAKYGALFKIPPRDENGFAIRKK